MNFQNIAFLPRYPTPRTLGWSAAARALRSAWRMQLAPLIRCIHRPLAGWGRTDLASLVPEAGIHQRTQKASLAEKQPSNRVRAEPLSPDAEKRNTVGAHHRALPTATGP